MMRRVAAEAFKPPISGDDLEIALAIEDDVASIPQDMVTLGRYLEAVPDLASRPNALEAALEGAIAALIARSGGTAFEAARRIATEHPRFADALAACALGLGIEGGAPDEFAPGTLLFGRWRIERLLGSGAIATVALARDEVLSGPDAPVEVVVKRFDDAAGSAAREHALREVRALAEAPAGVAPEAIALAAPPGERAFLVLRSEESRPATSLSDVAEAGISVRKLHRAGLAHGDLKPDHLRLRPDGRAFLIDFGLASPASPAARSADFLRLARSAELVARGRLERLAARTAAACAASGRRRRALLLLLLASPRHWRRATRYLAPRAALLATALVLGLLAGRAVAPVERPNPEPLFHMLTSTGRLRSFVTGPGGELRELRLHMPELAAFAEGGMVWTKSVRFRPDGSVEIKPAFVEEDLSQTESGDQ